ncbi:hypothetical protein R4Z09_13450 [Niallia oryzisoli]|uniref:DUF624 domain-containing protein n=1 Tax=Niallia oryzisoli TaxID=1737571 RepID=A0ABZ2CJD2_9BACI
MNKVLLQWALFSFMFGLALSLPLAAIHYQKNSSFKGIFTNYRKLKSAHLDYFMQALSAAFVYLIGFAAHIEFAAYILIPFIFGVILNPTILLLEATPYIRSGWIRFIYRCLRATSPASLLFAWLAIAFLFLPTYMTIILLAVILISGIGILTFLIKRRSRNEVGVKITEIE